MTIEPRGRERAALLRTHEALRFTLHDVAGQVTADADTPAARAERGLLASGVELREEYLASVPRIDASRCPLTGAVLRLPIDTAGLDGLWWDYQSPVRPVERVVPTLYAFTGALALGAEIPRTSFLVKAGPAAPYVLPRLLERASVRAVLSTVPVGPHRGYLTAYFSTEYLRGQQRANDWGANEYRVYDQAGDQMGWDAVPEDEREFDFDLAPWIERGKLSWIAPGDAALTLHDVVTDCPYLGVTGRRTIQRIEDGAVR